MPTLVLETGEGLDDANSYVSRDEADAYYAIDLVFAPTWAAFTDEEKDTRLIWATRLMDQQCTFLGYPTYPTVQALRWPRCGIVNRDGVAVSETSVPRAIKQATAELLKYAVTADPSVDPAAVDIQRVVVDVVEVHFQEGARTVNVPALINQILRGYGVYPAGGSSFEKIQRG